MIVVLSRVIGLNEGEEHLNIERGHAREKGNILASILSNVAVVTRALRKEGGVNHKGIVVAFL
jgi:hypothetical protein